MANNLKQKLGKGKKLLVDEMFYSIQTEGPFAGRPAYFVRLHGCNLNCFFCDTKQSNTLSRKMKVGDIIKRIEAESSSYLVVITGGEPFLQNIYPLIEAILRAGLQVQLETNGTLGLKGSQTVLLKSPSVYTVCSPKTKEIHREIAEHSFAFKYVVQKDGQGKDGLPRGLFKPDNKTKIMISPMFDSDMKATKANFIEAVSICKNFGYYLSLQTHKWDLLNIK